MSTNQSSGFDQAPRPAPAEKTAIPRVQIASSSAASELHPDRTEDSFFHSQRQDAVIAGVLDGVGGERNGAIASAMAQREAIAILQEMPKGVLSNVEERKNAEDFVLEALIETSDKVGYEAGGGRTTESLVVICDSVEGELDAVIGWMGDSGVYILRAGNLVKVTLDDSTSFEGLSQKNRWALQDRLGRAKKASDLSTWDLAHFKQRNAISQSVGKETYVPHTRRIRVFPGDRIFLGTDGITDPLALDEIQQNLQISDPKQAADSLIRAAQARNNEPRSDFNIRSKPDDKAGVIIDIPRVSSAFEAQRQQAQKPATGHGRRPLGHLLRRGTERSQGALGMPEPGNWVRVKRSNGQFEGNWVMMQPNYNEGTVCLIQIVNNLPWRDRTVSLDDLEKWNS